MSDNCNYQFVVGCNNMNKGGNVIHEFCGSRNDAIDAGNEMCIQRNENIVIFRDGQHEYTASPKWESLLKKLLEVNDLIEWERLSVEIAFDEDRSFEDFVDMLMGEYEPLIEDFYDLASDDDTRLNFLDWCLQVRDSFRDSHISTLDINNYKCNDIETLLHQMMVSGDSDHVEFASRARAQFSAHENRTRSQYRYPHGVKSAGDSGVSTLENTLPQLPPGKQYGRGIDL